MCESEPGRGTRFTVTIDVPIADVPEETPGESESSGDISGMNVLVAEDNDLNWKIITAMLGEYAVNCERVENGREYVDKLESSPDGGV